MKEHILSRFQRSGFHTFYEKYLQKVHRRGGDEFQALCIFHEDEKASFSFNNRTGQYYCHGCGKKGDAIHFYAKTRGLDTRRDFAKVLKGIAQDFGIPWEEQKSRIVETYDYVDEQGTLLYQVVRMEPKDFRQRKPQGSGWDWNLNGTRRVLYRLPEVLQADEVVLVEGEKDADNLAALGFCATTCPHGAGKWREEYNECLRGRRVILIPDNDNPGREHMAKVGASLQGTATSLKWLELPDVLSKGDVSDFIAKYQDPEEAAERLSILIENAEAYAPPKQRSLDDAVMPLRDFCALNIPTKESYLAPWLKENSINLISGWRGCGKTWFALGLLQAVSTGTPFGPWPAGKAVSVLFLDGEMPPGDIRERFQSLGIEQSERNPFYIYCDALANSWGLSRAHLASAAWRSKLKQILLTKGVKLWVVDNLASLASGLDENVKKDWDPINQWLLELRFAGISTIMLHHVNKEGGQRGTSAREDNLDTSIILKAPHDYTPEDGARFIVHFSKARVSTRDLPAIADLEFKLSADQAERYTWIWGTVKGETKKMILRLLDEGTDYDSIRKDLGLSSKGYITKVKKDAVASGLLTQQGKLTQSGYCFLAEG